MKSVYEASSGLDAHMILNLLEQHGIAGRVEGEYLQGGIGELAAMGFVRVLVADEDHAAAAKVVREWEAMQPPDGKPAQESSGSTALRTFVAGVFVGAAIMYWLLQVLAV